MNEDKPNGPSNRYPCTALDPWDKSKGRWALHPDAYEVGKQQDGFPGGDLVTYECPNCKHRWEAELPQ